MLQKKQIIHLHGDRLCRGLAPPGCLYCSQFEENSCNSCMCTVFLYKPETTANISKLSDTVGAQQEGYHITKCSIWIHDSFRHDMGVHLKREWLGHLSHGPSIHSSWSQGKQFRRRPDARRCSSSTLSSIIIFFHELPAFVSLQILVALDLNIFLKLL